MEYSQYSSSYIFPPLNYPANLQYETQDALHYQPPHALHRYVATAQGVYYSSWNTGLEVYETPMMAPPVDSAAFMMSQMINWPSAWSPGAEVQETPYVELNSSFEGKGAKDMSTLLRSYTMAAPEYSEAFIMQQTTEFGYPQGPGVEVLESPVLISSQMIYSASNAPQAIDSSLPEMASDKNSSNASAVHKPSTRTTTKKAKDAPKTTEKTGKRAPPPAKKLGKEAGRGKRGSNLRNASPGDFYDCHWDGCQDRLEVKRMAKHLAAAHDTREGKYGKVTRCQWIDVDLQERCGQKLQPNSVKAHIGCHLHKEGQRSPFVHTCKDCWKSFVKRGSGPCEHYEKAKEEAKARRRGRKLEY